MHWAIHSQLVQYETIASACSSASNLQGCLNNHYQVSCNCIGFYLKIMNRFIAFLNNSSMREKINDSFPSMKHQTLVLPYRWNIKAKFWNNTQLFVWISIELVCCCCCLFLLAQDDEQRRDSIPEEPGSQQPNQMNKLKTAEERKCLPHYERSHSLVETLEIDKTNHLGKNT